MDKTIHRNVAKMYGQDEIQKSIDNTEIEKGGEGSRGGKVIGYTKRGKAIYQSSEHEEKCSKIGSHEDMLKHYPNAKKLESGKHTHSFYDLGDNHYAKIEYKKKDGSDIGNSGNLDDIDTSKFHVKTVYKQSNKNMRKPEYENVYKKD
jgi:hypothetical protein